MNSLLYVCFHVWWLLGISYGTATPDAKAEPKSDHTDYEIPNYYGYRYGQDVYTPSLYDDPYVQPSGNGHDSYKSKDYGLHTYQSKSYDHKGYPPKGFVSVSYGQKGHGHNSYVHKTIGFDHKSYAGLYSPLYDSPRYGSYNSHGGYVHKGYEHKGSFVEHGYGLENFGHDVKGYGVGHIGYDGFNNGYGHDHILYDKVKKPYSHDNVVFGFAHQNLGLDAHLPSAYKVYESPYGDHLRYGYGHNILSPY